jgi:hypothetical protein
MKCGEDETEYPSFTTTKMPLCEIKVVLKDPLYHFLNPALYRRFTVTSTVENIIKILEREEMFQIVPTIGDQELRLRDRHFPLLSQLANGYSASHNISLSFRTSPFDPSYRLDNSDSEQSVEVSGIHTVGEFKSNLVFRDRALVYDSTSVSRNARPIRRTYVLIEDKECPNEVGVVEAAMEGKTLFVRLDPPDP